MAPRWRLPIDMISQLLQQVQNTVWRQYKTNTNQTDKTNTNQTKTNQYSIMQ